MLHLLLILLLFTPTAKAEEPFNTDSAELCNSNFKKFIHTVLIHRNGNELSSPVAELNGENSIHLSFDDLDADEKTYSYTFIHCNTDWQPSGLMETDYMSGYQDDRFGSAQYSFNTNQRYSHYSLTFPNENIRLTKSGNYIIKVFLDYDRKQVVFTRRFMLYEPKVTVDANLHKATGVEERRSKQEVDFNVLYSGYDIGNPFSDIKVCIQQNDRWDNAIMGLKPVFLRDKELIYDYDDENLFYGGTEFRAFDFRSTGYHSERVSEITYETPEGTDSGTKYLQVYLLPDERRSYKAYYSSKADLNGKFLITTQDVVTESSGTEADYCYIHFFLPYPEELENKSVYVGGALSDWNANAENRMAYNFRKRGYECTMFLKQGYYNYAYFIQENGKPGWDVTEIEGSHSETENTYSIFVYHRAFGSRYDELIGVKFVNTTDGLKY